MKTPNCIYFKLAVLSTLLCLMAQFSSGRSLSSSQLSKWYKEKATNIKPFSTVCSPWRNATCKWQNLIFEFHFRKYAESGEMYRTDSAQGRQWLLQLLSEASCQMGLHSNIQDWVSWGREASYIDTQYHIIHVINNKSDPWPRQTYRFSYQTLIFLWLCETIVIC